MNTEDRSQQNEQHHETVDDAARRDRLERAMSTRAARWCAEAVASLVDPAHAHGPDILARDLAGSYAIGLVQAVWARGEDPQEPWHVDSAWKHRALMAWSHLESHRRWGWPVGDLAVHDVAELEAADAAVTWQLESERIAR